MAAGLAARDAAGQDPAAGAAARHYQARPENQVQCRLCPRECLIPAGGSGYCTVRRNENGRLRSLVYGQACSLNLDPVEKKPLYHFLPGTQTLSMAAIGCNLRCSFCQNYSISMARPGEVESLPLRPERLAALAREKSAPSISYTYSEPTAYYEYLYDSAALARKAGIRNVWVTCGYINPEPLEELCGVLDAANVDLKGFSDGVYRRVAGAKLAPVLATLATLKRKGVWLEVGYLVIPTLNDGPKELADFCAWTVKNLGPETPVHFLRFFPRYQMTNLPATPVATLERACQAARAAGSQFVYIGNVPGHRANHTYCPGCETLLIERKGYFIQQNHLKNGRCPKCGRKIPGVWS
ncbi:MAG: Benzylsuccinate synthase activating enzyme [candidate division TA06 bacterium ADurb.Bin417]|uniref:Benzylsuccinate synthase activating enzyme n=1 Tax=candidate division TA06 bacterium ADurb.Bin417 TaxID=1852828 RepID=A0A1V5MBU8_UNCT6|nr:MAG: Benzylsuccinate synthase activating enzyme [candidate division TA06 bacterium ADurb.Bin417]